ncbi:LVIVD repeat-containing protein [Halorussus sp. AFM4]|uniref:LVIVD repeat-containing protein n=1 Tax=Halorussus sp. AFM4 TaxID=3421651 RepID=UPI003EBEC73A
MNRREMLTATAAALSFPALHSRTATAGQSASYEPLGSVSITNAKEGVVGNNGKTGFVATTTGFATLDISTPTNPTVMAERSSLLADRENGPLQEIWDLKVEGDRLVVAGPANPGHELNGFLLYDVSDQTDPEQLAFYETDFSIHNCFVRDGLVYLTGNNLGENPLVIVDVHGDQPEEVGRWSILDVNNAWADADPWLRWLHDVWVQDGRAYLAQWDAGTWLVDVSDPKNPEYVNHFGNRPLEELASVPQGDVNTEVTEPPGNHHYVTVNDDASLLGVGIESWDVSETEGGGPSGIELWDISEPQAPRQLSTIQPPSTPNPTRKQIRTLAYGMGYAHRGCHKCGHRGTEGVWTTSHNFDIVGDRLFSSWYQGGVKIHDISDPSNPEQLAWWRNPQETAFWTAKFATEETFLASSMGQQNDGKGGVYLFPNRRGQQQNPPGLTTSSTTY